MVVDKTFKKRAHAGGASRPIKKRKKQRAYHSDSEPEETLRDGPEDFTAVNLADSEDDIANAEADDGAATDSDTSSHAAAPSPPPRLKALKEKAAAKNKEGGRVAGDSDADDSGSDLPGDEFDVSDDSDGGKKKRSKRNDPSAFATSLSKILSTKLSATKRADPVLSRSTDALSSARAAADSTLEHKARKQMKEQKLKALEKGRVRDVMGGGEEEAGGSVAEVMEEERRLRKVAQRGVVKLFNAVRAAQVKAGEAERKGREDRLIGPGRREENVNEMSKKGFLDLIASGGK